MMILCRLPIFLVGMPGALELTLILLIVLLLFGAKRLPEIARSIGTAFEEFKKSITGGKKKDHGDD